MIGIVGVIIAKLPNISISVLLIILSYYSIYSFISPNTIPFVGHTLLYIPMFYYFDECLGLQ